MDVHVTEIVKAFSELGHEVLVVSPSMHAKATFGQGGELVRFIRERLPKVSGELLELAYNEHAYRRLLTAYRSFKPDVVYERANLFLSAGLRLRQRKGIPLLLEVNAPLHLERSQYGGLALLTLAKNMECRVWKGADKVFPVSSVLAETMTALGAPVEAIEVIPNGANHTMFNPEVSGEPVRRGLNLGTDVVLGFVGFAHEWHRLDRLVSLISALKNSIPARVLIVGDGPAIGNIKAQAKASGVDDRVHVTGVVDREEMPAYLAAFDIAFQPSATPYASPLKLLEYLAMGLPVVAPNTANILESAGGTGVLRLFDPQRPDSFIDAARLAIENSEEDKAAARMTAKTTRSWLDNAKRIVRAAEIILSRPSP